MTPWGFGVVLFTAFGMLSASVNAQTSHLPVATTQIPKKVVPRDPVGQLFNDGPRVVYTQDSGADPIEKLFWDRERKKEQANALRDSRPAELQDQKTESKQESAPMMQSEATSSEPERSDQTTAAPAAVAEQHPSDKQVKQQTLSNQPDQEVKQERKKKNLVNAPRNSEATKPQSAKQAPQQEAQKVYPQAKPGPDAGKVDGVAINSAEWPIGVKPKNSYGKQGPEGRPWQGLVFEVPNGTPVKAIDSGRVMYAHEFKNYGNLIIVDHGDRVASVYANNQRLLVKEGAQVGTGDVIALSGQTGSLNYPALYFELRKEGKPVDPLLFLKRR